MKRMWIGVGLLMLLLIAGLWTGRAMEDSHGRNSGILCRAADLALTGNWEKAEALTGSVRADWARKRCLTASLTHQDPMENIEGLFAQLKIYAASRDKEAYGAVCVQLASALEAVGKSNAFTFENLM